MLTLLAASVVAAGQTFTCTPTHVWDGDGPVWCEEGPRLRIAGIAAREIDGTCRTNQPCPQSSAIEARDALVQILGGARGTASTGHILVSGPDSPAGLKGQREETGRLRGAAFRTAQICPVR